MGDIHRFIPGIRETKDPVRKIKDKYSKFKVIKFKKKIELIQEGIDKEQSNFLNIVENYYPFGIVTMPDKAYNEFIDATTFFGTIISDISYDPEFFSKIFNANISSLDPESKFHKALLCFFVNPNDRLNYKNLKEYLENLAKSEDEMSSFYKHLSEYIDYIIDATMEAIENGDLSINMGYYEVYSEFKEEDNC